MVRIYPSAKVIDVTSKGKHPFVKFSPFYPHGNIPIPFSTNRFAYSVEGIWQGLKVFEQNGIDISKFEIQNMKGIKRTYKKFGTTLGHRKGIDGTELLDYLTARKQIYLPCYAWLLENKLIKEVDHLTEMALNQDLVLLDFETNEDVENTNKPLSHAALIKKFILKKYPDLIEKRFFQPEKPKIEKEKTEPDRQPETIGGKKKGKNKPNDQSQMRFNF